VQTHTTATLTMLDKNTTIPVLSRELFVLRKTSPGWRIVDYMFNHSERARS
jgi:hypothetical protein